MASLTHYHPSIIQCDIYVKRSNYLCMTVEGTIHFRKWRMVSSQSAFMDKVAHSLWNKMLCDKINLLQNFTWMQVFLCLKKYCSTAKNYSFEWLYYCSRLCRILVMDCVCKETVWPNVWHWHCTLWFQSNYEEVYQMIQMFCLLCLYHFHSAIVIWHHLTQWRSEITQVSQSFGGFDK